MTRTTPPRPAANLIDEPVVDDAPARPAPQPASRSARRLADRLYAKLAEAIDRRWRWDRFPTPISLALIMGIRDDLREHNLFDTNDTASVPTLPPEPPSRYLVARSVDGSYNDLSAPAMGMAKTRFGRNVPLADTVPEDSERVLTPNPRLVSTRLLARGPEMIPVPTLNVLAAAWLQFETRDWFSHGTDATRCFAVPRPPGDDWPTDPMTGAAHPARPARGRHLRQHRDPLVGRVPDLRQHAEVPGRRAPPEAGHGQGRDRAGRPDRHRPGAARQLRRPRRLVGRPGAAAHAVHARAQRRLRHARRGLPLLVGRRGVRQGPAGRRRAHRQDPHGRVDHRDPQPARAADRHADQLVRPRRGARPPALSGG